MTQNRGKMGLMAVAALIPFGVIMGVMMSKGGVEERAVNGVTSARRAAGDRDEAGRRLQTATYDFATQLEMTVCLTEDHSSDAATASAEQVSRLGLQV